MQAGAFGQALDLLATAEAGPLDEFASARVDLLRGHVAFASSRGGDASSLLLKAAKRLEPLNRDLARDTYLTAWRAVTFAGQLAGTGHMLEVCRAAQALPPPEPPPGPLDLLLEGFALLVTDGPAAAAPALRQAVSAFARADIPMNERLQFGPMAQGPPARSGTRRASARSWSGRSSSPGPSVRSSNCRSSWSRSPSVMRGGVTSPGRRP